MMQYLNRFIIIMIVVMLSQGLSKRTLLAQNELKQIKDLAKSSEIIMIGKVSERKSFWNSDRSRILTNVTIQAEEYLKGNSGSDFEVTVLGGEIGEIGEMYTHTPTFEDEEEVLIFAKKDVANNYRISGGESGKIKLLRDNKTGKLMTASMQNLSELKNKIKIFITE